MTRHYACALLVLLSISLADWVISQGLITAGLAREANPLAAQVIARFGWTGFLVGKLFYWTMVACWGLAPWKLLPGGTVPCAALRWYPLVFSLAAQGIVTAMAFRCLLTV